MFSLKETMTHLNFWITISSCGQLIYNFMFCNRATVIANLDALIVVM